jgi:hypothetical protein
MKVYFVIAKLESIMGVISALAGHPRSHFYRLTWASVFQFFRYGQALKGECVDDLQNSKPLYMQL